MGRKYKPRVKERVFELYQDEKVLNPSAIEIMGNDKTLAESYGLTLLYMSYKKITCQEVLYHHKSGATVLIEGDDLTEQSPRTAIFIYWYDTR